MKICIDCKEPKSLECFYKHPNTKDRLSPYCKPCTLERRNRNYEKLEKSKRIIPTTKRCRGFCGLVKLAAEFSRGKSRDGLHSYCKECAALAMAASRYGLTPQERLDLLASGCAICGSHEDLHIDHDHACCPGRKSCGICVRGVLCHRHNNGLGSFQDNTTELAAAIEYLNASRG